MNRHIELVHKGKKPFECNDCGKSFSQKINLSKPVKSVHKGNANVYPYSIFFDLKILSN